MAFSDKVTSITLEHIVPHVVDPVLRENTLARRVLPKAKKFRSDRQSIPLKYQTGVSGQSFIGADVLQTAPSQDRVKMTFEPKFYAKNVNVVYTDIAVNHSDGQVLELIELEMKTRAQEMADELGSLFYGDGTGNSGKDFLGLEGIVDDGTNTSTYGGLSRSTYPVLNSSVLASGGTLTLNKMATQYNAAWDSSLAPTIIMTDKNTFALYESLLLPIQRISSGTPVTAFGTGARTLEYKGIPVVTDRKCTTGTMYFLNEDYLDFYAVEGGLEGGKNPFSGTPLNLDTSEIVANVYGKGSGPEAKSMGFMWTGFVKSTNQLVANGQIVLGGQLYSESPMRHAKLTGITTV